MPKEAANPKTKVVIKVDCPYCDKPLIVKRWRERTEDPVPAEYKEWATAEKDEQQTLGLGEGGDKNATAEPNEKPTKERKRASGG